MRDHYALADYHIHPDFSVDAEGSVEEFCEASLSKGLAEICFTTHYDCNPKLAPEDKVIRIDGKIKPQSIENMAEYVKEVHRAHEQFYPLGLMVRCGVEVGYYPGCEDEIQKLFSTYPFHFKLAAIHELDDINICKREAMKKTAEEMDIHEFAERYFRLVQMAVEGRLFDAIAHFDYYRKYGREFYGDELMTIHREYVPDVFESMKNYDVGLEINTSAIRRGESEYYPSMDIVNLARSAGARIMAIGSDAHHPDQVALDFEVAAGIAYELFPYVDE